MSTPNTLEDRQESPRQWEHVINLQADGRVDEDLRQSLLWYLNDATNGAYRWKVDETGNLLCARRPNRASAVPMQPRKAKELLEHFLKNALQVESPGGHVQGRIQQRVAHEHASVADVSSVLEMDEARPKRSTSADPQQFWNESQPDWWAAREKVEALSNFSARVQRLTDLLMGSKDIARLTEVKQAWFSGKPEKALLQLFYLEKDFKQKAPVYDENQVNNEDEQDPGRTRAP